METRSGGDKWTHELNDPLPEFRFRSWHMVGLKSVTPRFTFGGPILSNRLHLLESIQYEMRSTSIITQPFPNNQQRREGYNSFTQLDYIVNPTNVLTATLHVANQHTRFVNLDAFNAEPVTPNSANSTYAAAVTDRASLGGGIARKRAYGNELSRWSLASGYSGYESDSGRRIKGTISVSSREMPRGWIGVRRFPSRVTGSEFTI